MTRARDVADDDIVKASVVSSRDKPANLVVENYSITLISKDHHKTDTTKDNVQSNSDEN